MKTTKKPKQKKLKFGDQIRVTKPGFYNQSTGVVIYEYDTAFEVQLFVGSSLGNRTHTFGTEYVELAN